MLHVRAPGPEFWRLCIPRQWQGWSQGRSQQFLLLFSLNTKLGCFFPRPTLPQLSDTNFKTPPPKDVTQCPLFSLGSFCYLNLWGRNQQLFSILVRCVEFSKLVPRASISIALVSKQSQMYYFILAITYAVAWTCVIILILQMKKWIPKSSVTLRSHNSWVAELGVNSGLLPGWADPAVTSDLSVNVLVVWEQGPWTSPCACDSLDLPHSCRWKLTLRSASYCFLPMTRFVFNGKRGFLLFQAHWTYC